MSYPALAEGLGKYDTDSCIMRESCLRFTYHWHSITICSRVMSEFWSIFDRILVRTSALHADLNPHANIRHLNCGFVIDKILTLSHSLLAVLACVVKSTLSHFVMIKQLKRIWKSEVDSSKICFKISTVSA